jgi:hypothetical protein
VFAREQADHLRMKGEVNKQRRKGMKERNEKMFDCRSYQSGSWKLLDHQFI